MVNKSNHFCAVLFWWTPSKLINHWWMSHGYSYFSLLFCPIPIWFLPNILAHCSLNYSIYLGQFFFFFLLTYTSDRIHKNSFLFHILCPWQKEDIIFSQKAQHYYSNTTSYQIPLFQPGELKQGLEVEEFILEGENTHHMMINTPHNLAAWRCSNRTITVTTHFNEQKTNEKQ